MPQPERRKNSPADVAERIAGAWRGQFVPGLYSAVEFGQYDFSGGWIQNHAAVKVTDRMGLTLYHVPEWSSASRAVWTELAPREVVNVFNPDEIVTTIRDVGWWAVDRLRDVRCTLIANGRAVAATFGEILDGAVDALMRAEPAARALLDTIRREAAALAKTVVWATGGAVLIVAAIGAVWRIVTGQPLPPEIKVLLDVVANAFGS